MLRKLALMACVALLAFAAPALAAKAPTVTSISRLADLHTPLPFPFDENVDADKSVDAALALAKQQHKRVFIDLGGNWCADCRMLTGLMDLPEVKAFVDAHYVVVNVDVGRSNRNLQIPARWAAIKALKNDGAPTVLIVDPGTNTLVDEGHTGALEDARHMDPQSIVNWIAQWAS